MSGGVPYRTRANISAAPNPSTSGSVIAVNEKIRYFQRGNWVMSCKVGAADLEAVEIMQLQQRFQ
jgi:hypothetical protein